MFDFPYKPIVIFSFALSMGLYIFYQHTEINALENEIINITEKVKLANVQSKQFADNLIEKNKTDNERIVNDLEYKNARLRTAFDNVIRMHKQSGGATTTPDNSNDNNGSVQDTAEIISTERPANNPECQRNLGIAYELLKCNAQIESIRKWNENLLGAQ